MQNHLPACKRLLVPLDGSKLAQSVVPTIESLALHCGAEVVLIHVLERRPAQSVHGEKHLTGFHEAEAYLAEVANGMRQHGVEVETHVHEIPEGDIALSIVQHSEEYAPDLIILCAHGNHGLKSFVTGRVGQQVLSRGVSPVLILQPHHSSLNLKSIVVPLDDQHQHRAALDLASILARAYDAELNMISVVPTVGTLDLDRSHVALMLPSAMRAILELDEKQGDQRLHLLADEYRLKGVRVQAQVLRGETVGEVLKRANSIDGGLVVMSTHGSLGIDAFIAGSIAPRIAAKIKVPLILVRELD